MRTSIRCATILLALAAPALAAPALAAQQPAPKTHDTHAQSVKPKLDAELTEHFKGIPLTDDQVQRITEIKARHHTAMDAVRKGAKDPNAAATKTALQRHMDAEHVEFKALLTAEHAKMLDANMKAHHKAEATMHHNAMKHEPAPAPRKPR